MNKTTRKCLAVFVSAICVKYSIDAHKVITYAAENETQSASQTQLTEGQNLEESTVSVSKDQAVDSETPSLTTDAAASVADTDVKSDAAADVKAEETVESSDSTEALSENTSEEEQVVSYNDSVDTASLLETIAAGNASVTVYTALGITDVNDYNLKFVNDQVGNFKAAKGTNYLLTLDDVQTIKNQAFSLITYYYKCMSNGTATQQMYTAADITGINENNWAITNRELVFKEKHGFEFDLNEAASGGLKEKVTSIVKSINDFPLDHNNAAYAINTEEAFGVNLDNKPGFEYVCATDITTMDGALIRMNLGTATLNDYTNIVGFTNVNDYNLPFIQEAVVKQQLAENRKLNRDDIGLVVINITNNISDAFTRMNLGEASVEDYRTIGADWIGTLDLKEINPLMANNVCRTEGQFNGFSFQKVQSIALNAAANEKYKDIVSTNYASNCSNWLNPVIYVEAVKNKLSKMSKPAGEYFNGGDLKKAIFAACDDLNNIYKTINAGSASKEDYKLAGIDVEDWIDVDEINDYVKNKINTSELYKSDSTYLTLKNLVTDKTNALKNVNKSNVEVEYNYNNFKDHDMEYRCEFNNDYTILGLKNVDKYMISLLKPAILSERIAKGKEYLSSAEIRTLQDNLITNLKTSYNNILSGNATIEDYTSAGFDWISSLNIYEVNDKLKESFQYENEHNINNEILKVLNGINSTSSTEQLRNDLIQKNIDAGKGKFTGVYDDLKANGYNNCYVELEKKIFHFAFSGATGANDRLNEYNINVVKQQLANNNSSITLTKFGTTICETLDAIKKAYNDMNSDTLPGEDDEQAKVYNFTQLGWVYFANVDDVTTLLKGTIPSLIYGKGTEKTSIDSDVTLQEYYDVQTQVFKLAMALAAVNGGTAYPADFETLGISNINDYTVKIAKLRIAKNNPGERYSIIELKKQVDDEMLNLLNAYKRMNAGTADSSDYPFADLENVFSPEDGKEALTGKIFSTTDSGAILNKADLDYSDLTMDFKKAVNEKATSIAVPAATISSHNGTRNHYTDLGISVKDTSSADYKDDYQLNVIDAAIADYKNSDEFKALNREHLYAQLERELTTGFMSKLGAFYKGTDANGAAISAADRFTVENFKFAGINHVDASNIAKIQDNLSFTSDTCTAADRTALQAAVNEIISANSTVSDAEKDVMAFENAGIFNLDEYTVKYAKEDLKGAEISSLSQADLSHSVYVTLDALKAKYLIVNSGQATKDDYAAIGIDASALDNDQLKTLNEEFNGKVVIDSIIRNYDNYRYNVVSEKNKVEIEAAINTILHK